MKRNESGPRTVNKRAPARLSPIMPAFAALLVFAFALPGMADFSGAIFTTISTGTTVNGNLYNSKDAVYLNGGPQNQNSAGLPSGVYYFQVTDPSGATLLSNDDISCRQVVVNNGSTVINGPTGPCPTPVELLISPTIRHPCNRSRTTTLQTKVVSTKYG